MMFVLASLEVKYDNQYYQMRVLHELSLNRQSYSFKSRFFGRQNELGKLITILNNSQGSITLVSGDRGSGKTSLIREAIQRIAKLKSRRGSQRLFGLACIWSWAREHTITLDIPLLATTTPKEKSRETILRMIVHTLISDFKAKNAIQRWQLPLTYKRRLKSLEATLLYSKVTRKRSRDLQLGHSGQKLGFGGSHEYELDLTYADIELQLRDFLKRFSRHIDFYVIFDELDKYETNEEEAYDASHADPAIDHMKPHEFVKELKNLFTLSNAKFIFTATENYFQEIDEASRDNRLRLKHYKYSIFTHKILISHFEPSSYELYFDHMFSREGDFTNSQDEPYIILKHKLMWISDLYPFATKKILFDLSKSRDDGTAFIDLTSIDNDLSVYGNNVANIESVLLKTYEDHAAENDAYFNRFLYKSLKKAADTIIASESIVLNKSNFISLLYFDMNFKDETERKVFFEVEHHESNIPVFINDGDTWEKQLLRRDRMFKDGINSALATFIAYLDTSFLASVSQHSKRLSEIILSYNPEPQDFTTTSYFLSESLSATIKAAEKRRNNLFRMLTRKISNTGIKFDLQPLITSNNKGRSASGIEYSLGWSLPSLIDEEIQRITQDTANFENRIADAITQTIKSDFSELLDPEAKKKQYVFMKGKKRYQVLINPHAAGITYATRRKDIDKVLCINPQVRGKINEDKKLIYFKFTKDDLSDYKDVMNDFDAYIRSEFKIKT